MDEIISRREDSAGTAQWLHVQVAGLLMRYAQPTGKDMVFKGGNALHLMHGSPRYSEDLDFIHTGTIDLETVLPKIERDIAAVLLTHPVLKGSRVELTEKLDRSPQIAWFNLTPSGRSGKVKVKLDFWKVPEEVLKGYRSGYRQVRSASNDYSLNLGPILLPTAELDEIYADKAYAVAARDRLKFRDIFDIWWLRTNTGVRSRMTKAQLAGAFKARVKMYPGNDPDLDRLIRGRLEEISAAKTLKMLQADLVRWLPVELHNLAEEASAEQMLAETRAGLIEVRDLLRVPKVSRQGPGFEEAEESDEARDPADRPR